MVAAVEEGVRMAGLVVARERGHLGSDPQEVLPRGQRRPEGPQQELVEVGHRKGHWEHHNHHWEHHNHRSEHHNHQMDQRGPTPGKVGLEEPQEVVHTVRSKADRIHRKRHSKQGEPGRTTKKDQMPG